MNKSKYLSSVLLVVAAVGLSTVEAQAHHGGRDYGRDYSRHSHSSRRDDIYDLKQVRYFQNELRRIRKFELGFFRVVRLKKLDRDVLHFLRGERREERRESYFGNRRTLKDIKIIQRRWRDLSGHYDYRDIRERKRLLRWYENLAERELKIGFRHRY